MKDLLEESKVQR